MSKQQAEKYINDHNNPIVKKLGPLESKLFLSSLSQKEEQLKEKCMTGLENVLKHDRVDRRLVRSIAEWIPEQNVAKVIKITGASRSFGIQNKNGKFLNPEETLFLLETNKLELTHKNLPVSIEEAYKNIKNVNKYLAYKKLALQGYKLKSKQSEQEGDKSQEPPAKIAKIVEEQNDMTEIFQRLRESGPQSFQSGVNCEQSPDYYVSTPTNAEKTELNLIVSGSAEFTSTSGDENNLNIYALCSDDDVAFYKFYNTNIPIL